MNLSICLYLSINIVIFNQMNIVYPSSYTLFRSKLLFYLFVCFPGFVPSNTLLYAKSFFFLFITQNICFPNTYSFPVYHSIVPLTNVFHLCYYGLQHSILLHKLFPSPLLVFYWISLFNTVLLRHITSLLNM